MRINQPEPSNTRFIAILPYLKRACHTSLRFEKVDALRKQSMTVIRWRG
jgi:hypothetical protein